MDDRSALNFLPNKGKGREEGASLRKTTELPDRNSPNLRSRKIVSHTTRDSNYGQFKKKKKIQSMSNVFLDRKDTGGGGKRFLVFPLLHSFQRYSYSVVLCERHRKAISPKADWLWTREERGRERERDLFLLFSGCCSEKGVGRSGCIDTPTTRKRPTFPIPKQQKKRNKMPLSCSKEKECFFVDFFVGV